MLLSRLHQTRKTAVTISACEMFPSSDIRDCRINGLDTTAYDAKSKAQDTRVCLPWVDVTMNRARRTCGRVRAAPDLVCSTALTQILQRWALRSSEYVARARTMDA